MNISRTHVQPMLKFRYGNTNKEAKVPATQTDVAKAVSQVPQNLANVVTAAATKAEKAGKTTLGG